MRWRVEFTPKAEKQFGKLDSQTREAIIHYLDQLIEDDPRRFGKALVGDLSGFWRYRLGKYRIICEIQNKRLVVEIISVGKRDKVYG